MSGWVKLEKDLKDDPRVRKMARALASRSGHARASEGLATALGGLALFWFYADTHVRDDDTLEVGVDDIGEIVGVEGFGHLLPTDWLQVIDANQVKLPGYHTHNGTEAKKRALAVKRQQRHRDHVTQERDKRKRRRNARVTQGASLDQDQTETVGKRSSKERTVDQGATVEAGAMSENSRQFWDEVEEEDRRGE